MTRQLLVEHYRCYQENLDFIIPAPLQDLRGYFQFGQGILCYGQTVGHTCPTANGPLFDASEHVGKHKDTFFLPFDPVQTINNLRYERYVNQSRQRTWLESEWIKKIYYTLRPFFPVSLRKYLQKLYLR